MAFTPHKPQRDGYDAFWAYKGDKGALLAIATGVGKTILGLMIAKDYILKGQRVVWLADKIDLVEQPIDAIKEHFPELAGRYGIVQAANNKPNADLVFASKDTLINEKRLTELLGHGAPSLVVADESHRSVSKSWRKVLNGLGNPRLLGLTATPDRDDQLSLGELWEIVFSYGILDAIRDKILRQPYAATVDIPELDLSKVGGRRDYNDNELWTALAKAHIVEHTVEAIKAKHVAETLPFRDRRNIMECETRGTLVFTSTVEQARLTADALKGEGFTASVISGDTPKRDRRRLRRGFMAGEIQFLCNAQLLTTGTDLPRASCVVLARPTKSWSLYVQMVGRALRNPWDLGDALIIDLAAGASRLHSLVAAPVLIAGGCQESPDGKHAWLEAAGSGQGVCQFCQQTVPCARRGGPHVFKDGKCKTCERIQCQGQQSPDGQHHWIPWDEGKRACIHCAMEIPDTITSLIGARKAGRTREPAAWQRIHCPGEVWAVHLGKLGVIFRLRRGTTWLALWHSGSGRPVPLSKAWVSSEECGLLTDDVFRKVEKVQGLAGGKPSSSAYRKGFTECEKIARRFEVWKM
jgi:superfamily II DNA or RNA helicase